MCLLNKGTSYNSPIHWPYRARRKNPVTYGTIYECKYSPLQIRSKETEVADACAKGANTRIKFKIWVEREAASWQTDGGSINSNLHLMETDGDTDAAATKYGGGGGNIIGKKVSGAGARKMQTKNMHRKV